MAQYSIDTNKPLWLVAFYGEPQDKHAGGIVTGEGIQQIYSIDPDFIEIGAVKLPEMEPENAVPQALAELRQQNSFRAQQRKANVFYLSQGSLTAYLFDNGEITKGPQLLGKYSLADGKIIGTEKGKRKPCLVTPAFDLATPEAAYYRTISGAIPISPVTGAPE